MNSGNKFPGYKTDESVASSTTDDDEALAEIVGTATSGAEDSGTDVPTSGVAPKQGTLNGTDSGMKVSTLSFLQKMVGVQDNFARQLETLTKRCNKWERRALYAEREVKSAEEVIKKLADLVEQNVNSGVTTRKKSVGFKGVKNPKTFGVVSSAADTSEDDVEETILPTKGLDSLERDDLLKMVRELCSPKTSTPEKKAPKKKVPKVVAPKPVTLFADSIVEAVRQYTEKSAPNKVPSKGVDSGAHTSVDNVSGPSIQFTGEKDKVGLVTNTASSRSRSSSYRATEAEERLFMKKEIMNLGLDFVSEQSDVREVEQIGRAHV